MDEVRLERNACRSVPDLIPLVEEARRQGRRVCFISDMHLRAQHIRDMLLTVGVLDNGDTLFVSSECAALKTTGGLFHHALRTLAVGPRDIQHIGDNEVADYQGAKHIGISATLYTRARLNRFEKATVACLRKATWRERSLAAVSKFTRLSRSLDEPECALWDLFSEYYRSLRCWLRSLAHQRGGTTRYRETLLSSAGYADCPRSHVLSGEQEGCECTVYLPPCLKECLATCRLFRSE